MPPQAVTGSLDGVVRAYALCTDAAGALLAGIKDPSKPTQQLADHWDNVSALDAWVSPPRSASAGPRARLASASWDASVRLYAWAPLVAPGTPQGVADGGEWVQHCILRGHGSAVWGVKVIDAARTLTACADMRIRLFVGSTITKQFLAHDDVVRTLAVWPHPERPRPTASAADDTGLLFASSGNDARIVIWDLDQGADGVPCITSPRPQECISSTPGAPALERILVGHDSTVYDLALLPGLATPAPRLVSASEDGTVRIWDSHTGQMLAVLPHRATTVWSVATLSAASTDIIVSACSDGHVCIWQAAGSTPRDTAQGPAHR